MTRKLIVGLLAVVILMLGAPQASAMPTYGRDWTARNGWIVWAENDRGYWIKTTCHWWAGSNWTWRIKLPPRDYQWTQSDAGSWGNRKPQNLRCSYTRLY
jgi:hypothetical protein